LAKCQKLLWIRQTTSKDLGNGQVQQQFNKRPQRLAGQNILDSLDYLLRLLSLPLQHVDGQQRDG
jgi:hypothetical protein